MQQYTHTNLFVLILIYTVTHYICTAAQEIGAFLVALSLCIPFPFACFGVLGRGSFQHTCPQVLLSSPSSSTRQQQTQAISWPVTQGASANTSDTAISKSIPHYPSPSQTHTVGGWVLQYGKLDKREHPGKSYRVVNWGAHAWNLFLTILYFGSHGWKLKT